MDTQNSNTPIVIPVTSQTEPGGIEFEETLPRSASFSRVDIVVMGSVDQAIVAARQGARVGFLGKKEKDLLLQNLRDKLAAEKIDTYFFEQDNHGLENSETPLQSHIALSSSELQKISSLISSAKILLIQSPNFSISAIAAIEMAFHEGVQVILDLTSAKHLSPSLLRMVDIVKVNAQTTKTLSSTSVMDRESELKAAGILLSLGVKTVLLLDSEKQELLLVQKEKERIFPHTHTSLKEVISSEDHFLGIFAALVATGKTLEEAVVLALNSRSLSS